MTEFDSNNIEDINDLDSFLNKSPCSFLLGQLIEKKDVKDFFKIILQDIIISQNL